MATAKKGIIDKALDLAPVKATKDAIGKAAAVVTDVVMDPPLAVNNQPKRKATAKKAPAKKGAKTMDRKLVSTMEDYEVKYLAQKHGVTQKAVKAAVAAVGHSRNKVEAELKKGKA